MPIYDDLMLAYRPVAWWPMGDRAGTVCRDRIRGLDLAYANSPTLGVPGIRPTGGTGVRMATNQYANRADEALLQPPKISMVAWYSTTQTTSGRIIAKPVNSGGSAISLGVGVVTNGIAEVRISSTHVVSSASTVNDGKTHFFVGTYDLTEIRLYIDAKMETPTAYTGAIDYTSGSGPGPFSVGAFSTAFGEYVNGSLNDVALFDYALAPAQIAALNRAGKGLFGRDHRRRLR